MSALTKSLHPDEKIKAGKVGGTLAKAGLGIAVVFLAVSIVLGATHGDHWKRFFYAYVVGWSFIASICIGVMWYILLHFLCRGRWLTAIRRIAEAMTMALPIVWFFGLVFAAAPLLGYEDLYYWAHPDAGACLEKAATGACLEYLNPTMVHKLGYLS